MSATSTDCPKCGKPLRVSRLSSDPHLTCLDCGRKYPLDDEMTGDLQPDRPISKEPKAMPETKMLEAEDVLAALIRRRDHLEGEIRDVVAMRLELKRVEGAIRILQGDQPRRAGVRRADGWSAEEDKRLLEGRARGETFHEIGSELGRTATSAKSRLRVLRSRP